MPHLLKAPPVSGYFQQLFTLRKFLQFFISMFWYRKKDYVVKQPSEIIISRLKSLWTKEYGYFLNKSSSVVFPDNFKLHASGSFIFSRIPDYPATIKGSIERIGHEQLIIHVKVRPHIGCLILFAIGTFCAIFSTVAFCFGYSTWNMLWPRLFVFVFLVFLSIGLSRTYAMTFLEDFEKHMSIKPLVNN